MATIGQAAERIKKQGQETAKKAGITPVTTERTATSGEVWTRATPSQTQIPARKVPVPASPAGGEKYGWGRMNAGQTASAGKAASTVSAWERGLTGTERREKRESVQREIADLTRQRQQAQVDMDMDTLNRVNSRMKELRSAQGRQTVGDRVNDTLSAAAQSYGAGLANAVGTAVRAGGQDPEYNRRQIARLQKELEAGGYSDGVRFHRLTEEGRRTVQDSIRRLADEAWRWEHGQGFAAKAQSAADRMQDDSARSIASAKEGAGALGQLAVDVGVAGTQMGLDALAAALTGGSALVPMAVRSFGGGAQEARRSGADLDQQLLYGVGSAALSVGTEKISNIAKPFQKMFGRGAAETIAGSLAKRFGENGAVQLMQRLSKTAAGRIALSAIGEGGEEFVEDVLQPFLKRATYDRDAKFDTEEAWYDFLVGAILGALGGGVEAVGSIGSKPARNQAETGAGTEVRAPAGVETARAETGVQGVQEGPAAGPAQRDVIMEAAARGGRLEAETAPVQQKAAPGTGTAVIADMSRFDRSILGNLNKARTYFVNYARNNFPTSVVNAETGKNIGISRTGIDKFLSGRINAEKYASGFHIPELVERAHKVSSAKNYHQEKAGSIPTFEYFDSPIQIDGKDYTAHIRVKNSLVGDKYYGHTVSEVEDIKIEPPTRTSSPETPAVQPENTGGSIEPPARSSVPETPAVHPVNAIGGSVEGTRPLNSDPTITQPSDSVKPSEDGLGAADAGSLSSAFERMQAQTDTFHPINENSARRIMEEQSRAPSEVPATNPETGRNITKTVSTILNSPLTSSEMAVEIERAVADGGFDYIPVTDKSAVQRAQADISNRGLDLVSAEFLTKVDLGQRITKNDIAAAMECYNQALAAGDKKTAFELAAAISDTAHDGAQTLQAMNLMNRLTPEGKLLTLRRYVDRLNRQTDAKSNGKSRQADTADTDAARADFVEQATGFRISDELAAEYLMAETDEARSAAWDAITTNLAEQLPSTFREKANFFRYTSMLLNPTTHVRNVLGNGIQAGARSIKNLVGAAVERAVIRDPSQRTKAVLTGDEGRALREFARGQYETDQDAAMGAGKYSDFGARGIEREILNKRKVFQGSNPLSRGVQAIGDLNTRAMDTEDVWFNRPAYVDSFAQALKAKGVTAAEAASGAKADLVAEARAYAIEEARRATYRNTTALSEALSGLGSYRGDNPWKKIGSFAADAFMPFRRTPANILTTGMDYSPLGLVKAAREGLVDLKRGDAAAADVVDSLSAGLTGTGIMALGAWMAAEGLLRVSLGDDDREEAYNKDRGAQKYALQLGGRSYTLDWASPSAMPLLAGASVMESAMDGGSTFEAVMDAMTGISDVVLETSMLSSLNDLISNWSYARNKVTYVIDRAASGYLGQYVPTAGGKIASLADDTVRKSYVETGTGQVASDVDYFLQGVEKKIPGARNTLQPKVDLWGEDVSNGTLLERVFKNFLSPGYLNTMEGGALDRELRRLEESVGSSAVYPAAVGKSFYVDGERKELTAEEYTKYARKVGQTRRQLVEELMNSEGYKRLDDANRAAVIASAYEYAGELGKMEVSGYVPRNGSVTEGALKSPLPTAVYLLYRNSCDRDGNGSTSETESAQTLMELEGLTDRERGDAWSAMNNKGKTEESRERKEAQNPFTGVLAKDYSPEQAMDAWEIFNGHGTEEKPYTQAEKKTDLEEELGISAREADDLFALMKRAAGDE